MGFHVVASGSSSGYRAVAIAQSASMVGGHRCCLWQIRIAAVDTA